MALKKVDVVYALIQNDKNQILMVENRKHDSWTLPGGAVEEGETLAQAAVREAMEETGYEVEVGAIVAVNELLTEVTHAVFITFAAKIVQEPDVITHDGDILNVRWVEQEEADRLMTYHANGVGPLLATAGAEYVLQTDSISKFGRVDTLLVKQSGAEKKAPMKRPEALELRARHGIEGDKKSGSASPSQVLITSAHILETYGLKPGDLRENIVVQGIDVDALPSGTVLEIGSEVRIRLTIPCAPCGYISTLGLKPSELVGKRGALGVVITDGTIREGDEVIVRLGEYPEVPAKMYERFLWVLQQVPAGCVVTYRELKDRMGETTAMYRAFPSFLKRALEEGIGAPVHRVLNTEGLLLEEHLTDQEALLAAEGVVVENGRVDAERYQWDSSELFYQK